MHDFETKYIISNAQALKVKAWLEKNFPADPEYPEAIISSIYFDSHELRHLEEKANSDYVKSKFRIRWYEDPTHKTRSDVCFFEFKHKVGERRFKKRIKAPNIYADLSLESPRFFSTLNELRAYEGQVFDHLFPSFIVSYTRKRFILPKSKMRICIDYNINVPKTNVRLMKRKSQKKYLSECVFELKGASALLPEELYHLERLGAKKNAFSKYERCFTELIDSQI